MLRVNIGDANDPGGQNRFTALRQFEIWTCEGDRHRRLLAGLAVQAHPHEPRGRVPGRACRDRARRS